MTDIEQERQDRIDDSIAAQLARSMEINAKLRAEIEQLRQWTGAERYWEARWRDEAKHNDELRRNERALSARITELLTFNNEFEERARKAERNLKVARETIDTLVIWIGRAGEK